MKRHIGQVAVVVSDQQHSVDFYSKVFGMDHIFGTAEFRGPDLDKVQRMEKAASSTRWLRTAAGSSGAGVNGTRSPLGPNGLSSSTGGWLGSGTSNAV